VTVLGATLSYPL